MHMAEELVRYEVRDRIAVVTIANGKANALAPDVIAQLDAALTRAEDAGEEQVGALMITGAPGMFSGGFDLKVMRSSAAAAGKLVTDGGALITRLLGSEVPVVIACSGHAVAAGALLLFGADERVGASGAFRIGLIETEIGMVLPVWAAELARERLSPRQLQIATVGAKMYDPPGALEAGFLDTVVDPDLLESTALEAAARWAKFPRSAYRGQVRVNRGVVLGRLADAIAVDRGRAAGGPL
jgi:enoyl-CoA hydratase